MCLLPTIMQLFVSSFKWHLSMPRFVEQHLLHDPDFSNVHINPSVRPENRPGLEKERRERGRRPARCDVPAVLRDGAVVSPPRTVVGSRKGPSARPRSLIADSSIRVSKEERVAPMISIIVTLPT